MTDNSNDNILGSLKTLLWSAFIGVVSFQALAPIVWDYLHTALGIGYYLSYWMFTWVYFLLLPVFVLGWLWNRRKLISNYLPIYKGDLTVASNFFLNGVIIFVALQFLITLNGFFFPWSNTVFYWVLGIFALCCGVLLFACYLFCRRHINYVFKLQLSTIWIKDKIVNYVKATKYFTQIFLSTVIVYVLLFLIAGLFICNWIEQNTKRNKDATKYSAYEAGKRSFAFQELNKTLNSESNKMTSLEDAENAKHFDLRMDSAAKGIKKKEGVNDTIPNVELVEYLKKLQYWTKDLDMLLSKLKKNPDSVNSDSITKIKSIAVFNFPDSLFKSTMATKADLNFLDLLKIYLGATSSKITKVSKSELGIQLRAVQTKGMLMLISLFFTLLALYIFIKIINKVQTLELEQIKKQLKVGYAPAENELQEEFETNVAESGKASNALWLMLTVTAWLLVPIFKIVKDEEINLGSPYKTPTFSGSSAGPLFSKSDNNVNSTSGKRDTFVIHTKFDTIKVSLVDGGNSKLDSPSVRTLLKEIKDKVNEVETKVGDVKNELSN